MITPRQPSVFICDNSEIVVLGVRTQLEGSGFTVLGSASDAAQAVIDVLELRPNVLIMDLQFPIDSGIAAVREIKSKAPEIGILVMTASDQDTDVTAALTAGADGYCTKSVRGDELLLALETISSGNGWLHKPIKERVLNRVPTQSIAAAPLNAVPAKRVYKSTETQLSAREREILVLITKGMTNNQIAAHLHISTDTVKTHVRKIMEKLQCNDRTAMAVKAVTEGLG